MSWRAAGLIQLWLLAAIAGGAHAQPAGALRCPDHASGKITRSGDTIQLQCECDAGYVQSGNECIPLRPELRPPECMSSARPSCNVYDRCFERMCRCEQTADRYFISYGKKYCQRFLESIELSAAGRRWRDKTLVCLQESIVPHLPSNAGQCNCGELKTIAFQAHVACYTQPDASICDLGLDDWLKIRAIIDDEDLRTREMLTVARICLAKTATDASVRAIVEPIVERLVRRLQ